MWSLLPLMSLTLANDNVNVGTHDTTNTKMHQLRPHIELKTEKSGITFVEPAASKTLFVAIYLDGSLVDLDH